MYCINCGKEIENNFAFCSECGAKQEIQPECVNEYNITAFCGAQRQLVR